MTKPTVCRPRFATPRSPERETRGAEVAAVALAFGVELMEWQKMVADVGSEMLPGTRTPAYRELIVTVPRQCGKTTLTLAFEIHRALMWGERQSIAYTAQTGHDAREKLLNDQVPLLDAPGTPVREAVRRIHRASGSEGVSFENGSRLFILNSGNDAGHGTVVDLAVIDEAFADVDDRREQSLLPAMITRSSGQILVISTAGTERSPFLRRKVDTGRAAVANGENEGIAYFEWSADEDADPGDIETWRSAIPAMGITIDERSLRHSYQSMPLGEFKRAYLNQWTTSEERVIPAILWNAACDDNVAPDGQFVIALDINPERSAASVVVADEKGRVELIHQAAGVGWVVKMVTELAKKWNCDVALDSYGPAGSLAPEIEDQGATVHAYTTKEMTHACAVFYDAIADGKVHIRRHVALDNASAAARKRAPTAAMPSAST